jgi:hypothetical protein
MKLPPLNALRYFDIAAQTENFVRAAEHLHVTHGAVSRQVRLLEESLGVELFERRNRAIFLTPPAEPCKALPRQYSNNSKAPCSACNNRPATMCWCCPASRPSPCVG